MLWKVRSMTPNGEVVLTIDMMIMMPLFPVCERPCTSLPKAPGNCPEHRAVFEYDQGKWTQAGTSVVEKRRSTEGRGRLAQRPACFAHMKTDLVCVPCLSQGWASA